MNGHRINVSEADEDTAQMAAVYCATRFREAVL